MLGAYARRQREQNAHSYRTGGLTVLPKRKLPNRDGARVLPQRFLELGTHSGPAEQVQPEPARSVDGLAAGIAHDFNNLLTVMLGNATVVRMRAEAQGDAQIARRAAQIEKAAERGGRLVAQLLAYARQQMLQAEDVRLPQLLADLQVLLARAAGERVRLNISCAPLLWRCRVDPEQLESALLNLVINARDAMPEGGSISICASNRSVAPAGARGTDCEPGDYVKVEVRDTGCGIPPALQSRVFEPFFTTKPIGQGSGLGLAQVQGFVRQSGGWVGRQVPSISAGLPAS
jgi:signal transduction histidine kinase